MSVEKQKAESYGTKMRKHRPHKRAMVLDQVRVSQNYESVTVRAFKIGIKSN